MNRVIRWMACLSLLPAAYGAAEGYVGSAPCKTCHADIWAPFFKNPHYASLANADQPPERTGCESCHGPAKQHIEAGGGKETIRAFSVLTPEKALNVCLTCHSQTMTRANIRRSEHTLNGVACTSCHSIHKAKTPRALLAKPQAEMCYQCHATVRAQFSLPFKHRVNEGVVNCSDCHNPHGAQPATWRMASRPRMVEAHISEEPCLKCHAEKRGPFVFEHAALRVDGCETCHAPHGSTNSRLLRRPVVFTMCLECHNGAGTFGRRGEGVLTQSPSHNMADPKYQNCTQCHVRIHGSNADERFLR